MGEKIVVGPINKGLRNDRTAFVIDNDSFPTLINSYQWRGRVKRKRGTSLLGRLSRFIGKTDGAGTAVITISPTPINVGISSFVIGTSVFYDPGGASPVTLLTNDANVAGPYTLDRATGTLTITGSSQISTAIIYFPSLPVMGLEDLALTSTQFPGTLGFDTKYSYNITTTDPADIYDVSFYKNPPVSLPGYVPKGTWTPTSWNGQDYQQFWSTNYQGALWATNGINVPFTGSTIGMQFKPILTTTVTAGGPPAIVTLQITGHGLVQGDFLFINEVSTTVGINFQTGYVINVIDANNVSVEFPNATIANNGTGGIAQYLTNRSDTTKDCLRWYDGDPTNASTTNPVFVQGSGWVNFTPPLSQSFFSIADLPAAQYYLVSARMIVPFKDRILFLGPVVQTSSGSPIYLQDTIIYSQNGTPYYTCSYTNTPNAAIDTPASASNVFHPILVPTNQTATSPAFIEDQTGFGGFLSAGIAQPMITASSNEDVIIIGFNTIQTRLIYTGNDIVPFNLFVINAELGSGSTFSTINMDQGVITRGTRGFIITGQTQAQRIDLEIPDQVFEISLNNNGNERFTAQRDFINEWIYFTYNSNQFTSGNVETSNKFPNQTLQFNHRDSSWAVFNESYTTYGAYRIQSGLTWNKVGNKYPSWEDWNDPWNSGTTTAEQQLVIAGNQQGFVFIRAVGTGEANSITIQNVVGNVVTSPNHGLNEGDYIVISGCLGTISTTINGNIYSVATPTANTFVLNSTAPVPSGTYQGGGLIQRMYVPFIQSKQFPVTWGISKKTRLGPQQYLLTTTANAQIQLLIFLSQNDTIINPYFAAVGAYNSGPIVPSIGVTNNSLIYSTTLYTCPESTNLGLTPANTNLQMIVDPQTGITTQQQIWHRINTSLIGDTVQVGFTISDDQMRDVNFNNQFEEIEIHGFILDVSPSQVLA